MRDYFLSVRPAYPWSVETVGLPALAAVAGLLVALTVWSYTGHPNANRRRILTVVGLRLLALLVALLTALRPSVGVQENPKNPTVLLVGVDVSESMSVKDEVNNQARIEAVRRTLERCQPLLDELAADLNVQVHVYKFSTADFSEAASRYTPGDPADGKRSDYATYLSRTFDRWQGGPLVRGHLVVGDGADNGGGAVSAPAEATRWGRKGWPITTFVVGDEKSAATAQDIVVTDIDTPSSVPIKTDVTVTGNVHAYGFVGTRAVARLYFDGKAVATEEVVLDKEKDNKVRMTVKAPPTRGEVKVRLVVGQEKDGEIVPIRGELTGENNQSEAYLTVTKDGLRILVIDRLRTEEMRVRDVLRSEKRFSLEEVLRQTDGEVSDAGAKLLDLDAQAYDVIIIGNVTPEQLKFTRGGRPISVLDKIREKVKTNGTGLMFLGGEHALAGMPDDLLPVTVPAKVDGRDGPQAVIVEDVDKDGGRPLKWYQTVATDDGLSKMLRLAKKAEESVTLWEEVNTLKKFSRLTGYNKMTRKNTATVYAWTTPDVPPVAAGTAQPAGADPLLVGWQLDNGARGRVLAFAGYDTFLWEKLGQPKTKQGSVVHTQFWKNCVLWLAHQEDEEGEAYVRPAVRQLKVGGEQTLRVGVKLPGGGEDPNAKFTVKVLQLPEGKTKPDDAEVQRTREETVTVDAKGAKVLFKPRAKGEYYVVMTTPGKNAKGEAVTLSATAKFIAIPDTSDEMLKVNADYDFMSRLSVPTGGKALKLEDLPGFLSEMKEQKDVGSKPRPKFYPDWRRNNSGGFLPGWLVLFALLLGAEWGLRRLWGMV